MKFIAILIFAFAGTALALEPEQSHLNLNQEAFDEDHLALFDEGNNYLYFYNDLKHAAMISRELYESKIYIAAKAEDEELMYRYNVDQEGANLIRQFSQFRLDQLAELMLQEMQEMYENAMGSNQAMEGYDPEQLV